MQLLAPAELLAALALRDFGGGGGLSAVGDPRMLDLLGQLKPNTRALCLERIAGVFDELWVHGSILRRSLGWCRAFRAMVDCPLSGQSARRPAP